jgi:amino acid permease
MNDNRLNEKLIEKDYNKASKTYSDSTDKDEFNINVNDKQDNTENLFEVISQCDDKVEESIVVHYSCFERYFSPIKDGSLRGSTIALASITFGGGCLSFPYAIAQSGPILGLIIFVIVGILSYWTLKILLINGLESEIMDYNKLTVKAVGNVMNTIANISNIILVLGLLVSYQYIIMSLSLQSLNFFFGTSCDGVTKAIQMVVCAVFIQIPVSCLKNISELQYLSISGTLALVISVLVIFGEFPFFLSQYLNSGNSISLFPDSKTLKWGWIDTVGIFLFGFSSHNGIFQIFHELKSPTKRRCHKVLDRSFYLEFIIYILLSFAGFFSTFYDTPDVFLKRKNFIGFENDYLIIVVKILLVVTLNSCLAMNYNIMRSSINDMCFEGNPAPKWIDFSCVVGVYIVTNIVTYFLSNAGTLLSLLGGIGAIIICFIVPILIDIKINEEKKSFERKVFNYVMLVISVLLGLCCTIKSLYDFVTKSTEQPLICR